MATVGEAEVLVHATLDLKQLQQLGWAARAVELAQESSDNVVKAASNYVDGREPGVGGERLALLNLAACCLARLWEIR